MNVNKSTIYIAHRIATETTENDENKEGNESNRSKHPTEPTNLIDNTDLENLQKLEEFYCKQFGKQPAFFVRVPGRVNIIGEHVDYNLLPVLPIAINRCTLLAVGTTKENSTLELRNMEPHKYPDYKCDLNDYSVSPPKNGEVPGWYNYYLCGVKGVCETLPCHAPTYGIQVALYGNIPPAAGVSSSSALVCAAVIATALIYNVEMNAKRLAELAAHSERYIGTEGGGMDQAIAFFGKDGCAQKIDFYPNLYITPIPLPEESYFLVANSLVEKNKAATSEFNERVVECRLACRVITHSLHMPQWILIQTFKELMGAMGYIYQELIEDVKKYLNKDIYTRSELCQMMEMEDAEFSKQFLTPNTQHMQEFKLKQRALHVVEEFQRVQEFCKICKDETIGSEERFNQLKNLIYESHYSLQMNYECSHPELDKLVEIAKELDVGARLMGAGWGGCIVALCKSKQQCTQFIEILNEKFYEKLPKEKKEKSVDFVFIATPRNGAELIFKASTNHLTTTSIETCSKLVNNL